MTVDLVFRSGTLVTGSVLVGAIVLDKGSQAVGAGVDLAVANFAQEWTIDETRLYSMGRTTASHGWKGKGKPVTTIVRGQVLVHEDEWMAERAGGHIVRPLGGA